MRWIKNVCILTVMICASAVDIQRREFPNLCQLILVGIYFIEWNMGNLWGAVLAVPFFIVSFVSDGMGMGDCKAVLLLGGLVGFSKMLITVMIGCIAFIAFGLFARKRNLKKELPFIPFLTGGYIGTLIMEVLIFEIFRCV